MQTFLPYPDFVESAKVLDYRRLGKQRVETKQLYRAITEPDAPWANHPAAKMWRGHEVALAVYGAAICRDWRERGYKDTLLPWFEERSASAYTIPTWFGDPAFHASHRSNLLRKLPEHYSRFDWTEPHDLPYIWPE